MRIGLGFDIHRLADGKPLRIGGVAIPFQKGFIAHSDGDVLLHALCDALLGAAALGDIGRHFPDNDPRFAGADSRVLLRHVQSLITEQGLRVNNIDANILAEAPKLAPHINAMREVIAADLQIAVPAVSIKAKTMEKLGEIGNSEAIAAEVIVLLLEGNAYENISQ